MRFFLFLSVMITSVTVALSGLLPGQDAYLIRREAATLPDGSFRQAKAIVIDRPQLGTYVPGVILVKTRTARGVMRNQMGIEASPLNRDLAPLQVADVSSAYQNMQDAEKVRAIGIDRIYRIRYSEPIDPFDACARLMENPDVEYAVPERVHQSFYTPNDTRYSSQTWMAQMKLPAAWDVTKGASTVIIAIVDSGTDWTHEDLTTKIWTNTKEVANNGKDDDNNGFIDDVRGWDFVGNVNSSEAQAGTVKPDNDPKVSGTVNDQTGHGTVVAGCSGAATDNAKGVASTGFGCRIIPIKVGSDNSAVRGLLRGYEAIAYAADLGAHIINCSWGGAGVDPGAQDVIDYATSKGSLVVAASGNDGLNNDSYLQSPASLDGVLSVGSCNSGDRVSSFSNYGMNVDVYAPGENILSTYQPNTYRALTGTSFSSPLTSGIAGLVKAVHPTWTPMMIHAQLRGTVDMLQGVTVDNRRLYWGRVNAQKAVTTNASFTSGDRTPGLMLSGLTINGSATGRITTTEKTSVKFTLKNVLADASNVLVTATILDGGVKQLSNSSITMGTIARDAQASGTIDLQLDDRFPWYSTNLRISLTISSGSYVNHEVLFVPVELPTSNTFQMVYNSGSALWRQVDLANDGTLYATGTIFGQRAMLRAAGASGGFLNIPYTAEVVHAFSSSTVFIGGFNQGLPTVSRSFNGGQAWANADVSPFVSTVAGIHMFDAQIGVVIGNPVNGKMGLARTTNAGAAWAAVPGTPVTTAGESIQAGSAGAHGDAMWFGTSTGRVFFSLNKGQSWSQGSSGLGSVTIQSIAFRDSTNGVMLYRIGSGAFRIATSVNGGLNWKAGTVDINSAWKITPVKVLANQGHHLLIASEGQVYASDNNGTDWQPVLSKPVAGVVDATAIVASRPVVVVAGEEIGSLQYRYAGPNGSKLPQFTAAELNFGALESGSNRNRTVTLKNNGTSDLNVSKFEIVPQGKTPAGGFVISTPPKNVVSAGSTITIPLRCVATDTGVYRASLRVVSDGNPGSVEMSLIATVGTATSVSEDAAQMGAVLLWPNPAATTFSVRVEAPCRAMLISSTGTQVASFELPAGTSSIDVTDFARGAYRLVIMHGLAVRSMSLIVE